MHASWAIVIIEASETPEVRETTVRRRAFAGSSRAEVTAPLRGQTAGLVGFAIPRRRAATAERRALRAAAQAVRKNQRTFTAEMLVFCAQRWIRRKLWLELRIVNAFAIASHLQAEARGCRCKGQAGNARLLVLNLCAQLHGDATAAFFSGPKLGIQGQHQHECTRFRTFPAQLNAIASALGKGRVKLQCHGARAWGSARAKPDHARNCQAGAHDGAQALRGPW